MLEESFEGRFYQPPVKQAIVPQVNNTLIVMTKEELVLAATDAFAANPKADEFYQTADGQCFEVEDDAVSHCKSLLRKGPSDVTVVKRDEKAVKAFIEEQSAEEAKPIKKK